MDSADPINQPFERAQDGIQESSLIGKYSRHVESQGHTDQRDDEKEYADLDDCVRHSNVPRGCTSRPGVRSFRAEEARKPGKLSDPPPSRRRESIPKSS